MMSKKYKTVIIKVSGEALANEKDKTIYDKEKLSAIAEQIDIAHRDGTKIGIVVGAGNIWRGRLAKTIGIEDTTADYMGMLGTIMNALAIQSALEERGLETRVMSSINVPQVCEPYIRRRAVSHLDNGRIVIFAGGTGNPFFSTDSTATLRAREICADAILMGKNGIDGVYDSDPRANKDAKFIKHLTYHEVVEKQLGVMDLTAVAMLESSDIVIHVFNMDKPSSLIDVLEGKDIGTTIAKE
ncbi:MAG: UMP kinase [Bacilli bacterium]|nr:UMP kinase [Bacilli bacterium]